MNTRPLSITIRSQLDLFAFSLIHLRRTAPIPTGTTLENPYCRLVAGTTNGSSRGKRSASCIFLELSSDRRVSPRSTGACGARTRTSSNTARTSSKGPVAALLGGIAVSVHGSYEEESANLLADCAGCEKVWFVDFHDRTGA